MVMESDIVCQEISKLSVAGVDVDSDRFCTRSKDSKKVIGRKKYLLILLRQNSVAYTFPRLILTGPILTPMP